MKDIDLKDPRIVLSRMRQGAQGVFRLPLQIGDKETEDFTIRLLTNREEILLPLFVKERILNGKTYKFKIEENSIVYKQIWGNEYYNVLAVMASTPYEPNHSWGSLEEYSAHAQIPIELADNFYSIQLAEFARQYEEIQAKYNVSLDDTTDEKLVELYDQLKKRVTLPKDCTYAQLEKIADFLLDEIEHQESLLTTISQGK